MKLYNIHNVKGFFNTVKDCKGTVEMVLPSKDTLDIKSDPEVFSTLIDGVTKGNGIIEIDIKAEYPEDLGKLLSFAVCSSDITYSGLTA